MAKGRGEACRGPSLALGDTPAPRLSYRHLAKDGDHTESAAGNAGVALRFTSESRIRKLQRAAFPSNDLSFFFFPPKVVIRIRDLEENYRNAEGAGQRDGLGQRENVGVTVSLVATETQFHGF